MGIRTENLSTALTEFGTWRVEKCSTEDCWCRIIMTDTDMNLDGLETPRLMTDGSDDLDFCIIPAGALPEKYANLVAAAPKMLYALEQIYHYLNLSSGIKPRISDELKEIAWPAIAEARGYSPELYQNDAEKNNV